MQWVITVGNGSYHNCTSGVQSWEVDIVEYEVGWRAIAGVAGHDVAVVIDAMVSEDFIGVIDFFAHREVLIPTW